ncbi:MAG: hypothetical protein A2081_06055 [Elusimicrobia bacterium GWC2_61_19]|nr:MAG: hypothetical protein A2081_06055 [Elusimicrobia bacterium GWC2_61_19]
MKKLYELGARTGLSAGEVNRIARFGLLGVLAVGLASLAACFRAQKPPAQAVEPRPQTLQDLANSVNASTAAAKPADAAGNCGPYPGYPCGTRYYTVCAGDFRRQA